MTNLEEQIKRHREFSKKIQELEEQKKALGLNHIANAQQNSSARETPRPML
jgi:SMC interacting uncharacterized protein involved in chromosome segregation